MRYAQGGGVDAAGRAKREALRMQAAGMFTEGIAPPEIARQLRVSVRSVYRWKAAFAGGGTAALTSRGPLGQRSKLSEKSQVKLAAMLEEGPAVHGWDEDQVWTGARVAKLIGRKFHVSYSPEAARDLMHRLGFTPQRPARRAAQRDEAVVAAWKELTWPEIKSPRPRSVPGCASRTKQVST
ncbi:MAG: winged helix-turn-helix domain-containing protein [Catenulispora sp.]